VSEASKPKARKAAAKAKAPTRDQKNLLDTLKAKGLSIEDLKVMLEKGEI
jgi:hypothetical protein